MPPLNKAYRANSWVHWLGGTTLALINKGPSPSKKQNFKGPRSFEFEVATDISSSNTYFRGLANNLCPIVTKLVSWFDMNQAREETLHTTLIEIFSYKCKLATDNITEFQISTTRNHQPSCENMLPKSKYCGVPHTIMLFKKFFQQVPQFEGFLQVIIL